MTNSNAVNETEIMKKITLLTLIIITILAAAGCRRSKSNGKIDGFWRISTIEMTQTGEIKHPEDYFIRTQLEITQWPGLGTGEINYPYLKHMLVDELGFDGIFAFELSPLTTMDACLEAMHAF